MASYLSEDRGRVWKDYMERIVNEEKKCQANSVSADEVEASKDIKLDRTLDLRMYY